MTNDRQPNPLERPLEGHTVLITGAAGDIGRATAQVCRDAGAELLLADVHEAVHGVADELSGDGSPVATTVFDVTDEDAVTAALRSWANDGLMADRLFNNAGYQGDFANIIDQRSADVRRVLDINVVGVFNVLTAFSRILIEAGRPGVVVNTASMAHGGPPNMAAYGASKAAVVALTKTAAKDLAPMNIRVNSVSPAFIGPGAMWDRQVQLQAETPSQYFADTETEVADQMIGSVPMRRYGSLQEVAQAVLFLLSDQSSYITGFDLHVSGGAL